MLEYKLFNILIQYFMLPICTSFLLTFTLSSLLNSKYVKVVLGGLIAGVILFMTYEFFGGFEITYYYSFAVFELVYMFYGIVAKKPEVTTGSIILLITTSILILAFLGYIPKF